jgi:hypothetical protein
MAINIGDSIGGGATVGPVLYVGGGTLLAQDNNGFFFDASTNTLKTADTSAAASQSFAISTGDITGVGGTHNSGGMTIDTGNGSSTGGAATGGNSGNSALATGAGGGSDTGAGGVSGNVTVSTGPGGASNSGAAGSSGNLLLKTGNGGTSNTGYAGNGGSIIIQPGTSGGGLGGSGGSTLVRAPANVTGNIFAVQDDTGSNTYWSVSSTATLTGTRPLSVSHSTTTATTTFAVTGSGAKTAAFTAASVSATATSSTASITKTALSVQSTNTWNGTNAVSRALHCNATGGAKNYAAVFEAGNVGVNVVDPTARLHLAAGSTSPGTAPIKFTSGSLMTATEAGAVEWDGTQLHITQTSGARRRPIGFGDTAGASAPANHYSTGEFSWNYSSAFGGGPISGSITHGLALNDPRAVFRPEDYGGVYNVATIAQAQANKTVIDNIKAAMPDTGGIIELRDEFFVYGTINNPIRSLGGFNRAIPFGIVGSAPGRSILVNVQTGVPAIDWTNSIAGLGPSSTQIFTLRDLSVISQGPGIKIGPAGGGGQLQISNVEAIHCKGYGWSFEQFYGFSLWNCRAFYNQQQGFKFADCVLWTSVLDSMWNQGAGVYAVRTGLKGRMNGHFHVEGNESWGLDFDSVYGDLEVWQEGNRYTGPGYIYTWINSRLRNCAAGLTLHGHTQNNIGLGFDLDDVSRTGTLIKRSEVDPERLATLEPFDLGLPAMGTNATFDNTAWQSGFRPSIVRDGETLHLDIVAGTYNHFNASWTGIGGFVTTPNAPFIELFPSALNAVTFQPNQWLEFVFSVELDGNAGAFFYNERDNNFPALAVLVGNAPLTFSTVIWIPLKSGGKKTFCLRGQATSSGSGARLVWIIPKSTAGGNVPSAAHRVSLTNLRICRIPG